MRWQIENDTFMMDWTERGGPSVRPPDRRGFGSTVIEAMAKRTVGGGVEADYGLRSLRFRMALDLPSSECA
jgi:two-component sensor histidine kinase